ncbi:prefoldin subunit 5 [Holotrichia oblita]|uniref:Prefoldin subunit 5 n=1 Tax=Holotrichia oblita TaxID=644536 RepID=A0ACB9SYY8_HOLOL|nr:prefoldin subunit 5 [Holotrichia oblita]
MAQISAREAPHLQQIDLTTLNLQQLSTLKQQLDQDIESGKDYFKRKINFVTEQMEKIQVLGLEKSKIRDAVVEVMELKMQNQTA